MKMYLRLRLITKISSKPKPNQQSVLKVADVPKSLSRAAVLLDDIPHQCITRDTGGHHQCITWGTGGHRRPTSCVQ